MRWFFPTDIEPPVSMPHYHNPKAGTALSRLHCSVLHHSHSGGSLQLMEVQSVSPRNRPLSPFTLEAVPSGSPEPQQPQSPGQLSDLQAMQQSTRRSFRSDELPLVEHTVETGLIARVSREGKLEVRAPRLGQSLF